MSRFLKARAFTLFLLIVLGIYAAWLYLQLAAPTCLTACAPIYRGVIAGTANSPYRYRLLSFGLVGVLGGNPQTDAQIAVGFVAAHALVFPALLVAYYAALRRWLTATGALLGVVLLVMYLPVMFRIYGTSLYAPVELLLISLALWWRQPGWRYGLMVIAASLNRETGILLVLAFAALHWPERRNRRAQVWTLVYAALWASLYIGLRLARGAAPDEVTIAAAVQGNLFSWLLTDALTNHAFFVPLYVAVIAGWKRLDREVKRLWIGVGLPYLALVAMFGLWNEVRLLMPLLPLLTVALVRVIESSALGAPKETKIGRFIE